MGFWVMCPHCHKSHEVIPGGKRRDFDKLIERTIGKVPFAVSFNISRLKKLMEQNPNPAKSDFYSVLQLALKHPKEVDKSIDLFLSDWVLTSKGLKYLIGIIKREITDAKYGGKRP